MKPEVRDTQSDPKQSADHAVYMADCAIPIQDIYLMSYASHNSLINLTFRRLMSTIAEVPHR